MIRRIAGVVVRPRATLSAVVRTPAWLGVWFTILLAWALAGGWLLSTEIGQQALVDEQVRSTEAFGGIVTDAHYATLQEQPPWWVYFTSGGRLLLNPAVTLLVALGITLMARRDGARASMAQGLAVSVHASVVLVIGQLIATPIHFVRESLTSPFTLASVLPLVESGSLAARAFGTIDIFSLWWGALVAVGLAALTGRGVGRYAWPLAGIFLVSGALVAGVTVVMGGS